MAGDIKILETFRDAIQGLPKFVPTVDKVEIIRAMFDVGFDYLDIGSFVSSRWIPQFRDMKAVLDMVGDPPGHTKLFVLTANPEGAKEACKIPGIDILGYPFSTSGTFLKKNINADFPKAWSSIESIQEECLKAGKELLVYLAMAFGNPYGDPVSADVCLEFTGRLHRMGIRNVHLSDITGVASPPQVEEYFRVLRKAFPDITLGIHLHVRDIQWYENLRQAYLNGCRVFDGVISGLGGCPMTGYEMLHNLPTGNIIEFAQRNNLQVRIDLSRFHQCRLLTETKLLPYS